MALIELIEKTKKHFANCLNLENQGHLSLKKALVGCYKIMQEASDNDLKGLLKGNHIKCDKEICDKNRAKVVLWLTIGKPNSSDSREIERQKARIRMYARILNKFYSKNIDVDTAEIFLEEYGVYAIANLKKLYSENHGDDNDDTSLDEESDDENDNDENEDENQNTDKRSSQIRKTLNDNGIKKKRLILIKIDKAVYLCSGTKITTSIMGFLKRKQIELQDIDEI